MKVIGRSSNTGSPPIPDTFALRPPRPRPPMQKRDAELFRQRIYPPEPGVVPGAGVFRPGIAQADDQAQCWHATPALFPKGRGRKPPEGRGQS